jgi:uncharacterized protein (DUF2062 family)
MRAARLRGKIIGPILGLIRQGTEPEKIALSIALGITLGVTPVLGSTSILCLLAAVLLRLNLPLLQLVNYFVYPLQFALLIPFIRMGEWIFAAPPLQISLAQILDLIRTDIGVAIATLWTATIYALVAWLALGSLASLMMYMLLAALLRKLADTLQMEAG